MDKNRAEDIFPEICDGLFSYDEKKYKEILENYFVDDAKLSHPLLNVEGTHNIFRVFRVWTSLNLQPPQIDEYPIFDVENAFIRVTQHFRPRILPFVHLSIPSVTILKFRKADNGLYYIVKQEDNWTLEGLIQSVPLINWWYDNVVRVVMGGLFTRVGSFLDTANVATYRLTENSHEAISHGQTKAKEYLGPFKDSYINPPLNKAQEIISDGLTKGQHFTYRARNAIWNAQEGVKNHLTKVTGGHSNLYINENDS
ncbi:8874_t:CDS:2 [Diversispora eburnea]|uniref:8874_t:CDS:1 n=1 Tax=Diversispora eburnea TaxID=1213867 RepID=A0A9N8V5C2_9GLOM|nr:8874_t:CDS:2 [Diversispora eburnea]